MLVGTDFRVVHRTTGGGNRRTPKMTMYTVVCATGSKSSKSRSTNTCAMRYCRHPVINRFQKDPNRQVSWGHGVSIDHMCLSGRTNASAYRQVYSNTIVDCCVRHVTSTTCNADVVRKTYSQHPTIHIMF